MTTVETSGATRAQTVRNLVDEIIRDGSGGVIEHVWTLARLGALALMPLEPQTVSGEVPNDQRNIPTFIVTEFGRRLLNEPNFSPQD